ncbi:MAG: hypothetical protein H0U46_06830 [Actinobacteria bacterium]|nr:hypothetical protein [Actinomycetota bacterium]
MERVGEHPVPAGPLAVRWLAYSLGEARAGTSVHARLRLENAGTAPWRSRARAGVQLAYHWLDSFGNPIVWDGVRATLPRVVQPGEDIELDVSVLSPRPPGGYRLAFDLVEEHRFWFQELGSTPLDLEVEVRPRIDERLLRVVVEGGGHPATEAALSAQEESLVREEAVATAYLVAGAEPDPSWSRLLLDAHAEGWAAVGAAVEVAGGFRARGERARFAPWAPGGGRNPRFDRPLLFPSLLDGLEPTTHAGLPAYSGTDALFDGRAVVRLRQRSDRRNG